MKKSVGFIALAAFILASIVLNVVLFLTVPSYRLSEGAFWLIWAFTFPLNLAIAIGAFFYLMRKSTDLIIHVPVVLAITIIAFIAYVYAGANLIYGNAIAQTISNVAEGTNTSVGDTISDTISGIMPDANAPIVMQTAIITEVIITAVYILLIIVAIYVLNYMERNQKITKEKVLFIRLLKSDIEGCIPFVSDPQLVNALNKLAEKVRFSDPMSHKSLESCESEMNALVADISMKARVGDNAAISENINKVNILLDYRNERCKILK